MDKSKSDLMVCDIITMGKTFTCKSADYELL